MNPTVVTLKLVPEIFYVELSAGSTMNVQRDASCSALKRIDNIDDLIAEREEDSQADRKVAMWTAWDLAKELFPGLKVKKFFRRTAPKSYAVRLGPLTSRRLLVDRSAGRSSAHRPQHELQRRPPHRADSHRQDRARSGSRKGRRRVRDGVALDGVHADRDRHARRPSVRSAILASRKGVASLPVMPSLSISTIASLTRVLWT